MMEHLGCKATQAIGDCNQRAWNGGGSCTHAGFACISCTAPNFENDAQLPCHAQSRGHSGRPAARHAQGLVHDAGRPVEIGDARSGCAKTPRPTASSTIPRRGKMSRLVVGPFNRVEGDLELTLDIEAAACAEARVATTLYRGFEQILLGRPAADALTIAPRICGICSVSQSIAAAAALRALSGVQPPPNGELAANIVHAAENIADHLTHFYLFFMPDFARASYADEDWFAAIEARFKAVSGAAAHEILPARARLLHIMGLIAGKWPHSPGLPAGRRHPRARSRRQDAARRHPGRFPRLSREDLFAAPLEHVAALATPEQLADFAQGQGDFAGLPAARARGCGSKARPRGPAADRALAPIIAREGLCSPPDFTIRARARRGRCRSRRSARMWLFPICATAPPIRRGP